MYILDLIFRLYSC